MKPSLQVKLLFYVLLPAFIVLLWGLFWRGYSIRDERMHQFQEDLHREMNALRIKVERFNEQALDLSNFLACAQESYLFGKREDTFQMCKKMLESMPELSAVFTVYTDNADGQDGAFADRSTIYNTETGQFVAYWFRNRENQGSLEPLPFDRDALMMRYRSVTTKLTQKRNLGYVVDEPFLDPDGRLMVDYAVPIYDKKRRFLGFCGATIRVNLIHELLRVLAKYGVQDYILLSRGGHVIASSMKSHINTLHFEDILFDKKGTMGPEWYKVREGRRVIDDSKQGNSLRNASSQKFASFIQKYHNITLQSLNRIFTDRFKGKSVIVGVSIIPKGHWRMICMTVTESILMSTSAVMWNATSMILMALLGLALMLAWVSHRIKRRIESATQIVQGFAQGIYEGWPFGHSFSREDHELEQALHALQEIYRDGSNRFRSEQKRMATIGFSLLQKTQIEVNHGRSSLGIFRQIQHRITELSNRCEGWVHEVDQLGKDIHLNFGTMGRIYGLLLEATSVLNQNTKTAEHASAHFMHLYEKNRQLEKSIEGISHIASQMNLLALNAAIEAEKASEHGLGFSAVSRRIGKLADETLISLDRIKHNVIESMNVATESMSDITDFGKKIENNRRNFEEICNQTDALTRQTHRSSVRFHSVSQGVHYQSDEIMQCHQSTQQLSEALAKTAQEMSLFKGRVEALLESINKEDRPFADVLHR